MRALHAALAPVDRRLLRRTAFYFQPDGEGGGHALRHHLAPGRPLHGGPVLYYGADGAPRLFLQPAAEAQLDTA
jgi:hypothetical protein